MPRTYRSIKMPRSVNVPVGVLMMGRLLSVHFRRPILIEGRAGHTPTPLAHAACLRFGVWPVRQEKIQERPEREEDRPQHVPNLREEVSNRVCD